MNAVEFAPIRERTQMYGWATGEQLHTKFILQLYTMQVKCDECESWFHQRCVNVRIGEEYSGEHYESAKFVGACCSNDRQFKVDWHAINFIYIKSIGIVVVFPHFVIVRASQCMACFTVLGNIFSYPKECVAYTNGCIWDTINAWPCKHAF